MSGASDPGRASYLDHAATTPMRPEVVDAMTPFAAQRFANASSAHRPGRDARRALEDAREEVASILGARPDEVVFTGGGTEANNLAVFGALAGLERAGPVTVVCSAVEHPSVREPCRAAAKGGGPHVGAAPPEIREIPVDVEGRVDLGALETLLGPDVALVSVMAANNENGTIQPVGEVVERAKSGGAAVVHTDAVQAAGHLDVADLARACDLVSVSAHKIGGPKGTGALVARRGIPLEPIVFGGGQEREVRSGTYDVAGAVGLAVALRAVAAGRVTEESRLRRLRDRLADGLLATVPGLVESVSRSSALAGHCHVRVAGVDREELLVLLDEAGVYASAGAACASGALQTSHVLAAMGVSPEAARGAVRFTLGWSSTDADVDHALEVMPSVARRLRL